jgi:hypothetical protein
MKQGCKLGGFDHLSLMILIIQCGAEKKDKHQNEIQTFMKKE